MFAILDDVQARLGRPITDEFEVAQVNAWLRDAEALVLARIPDLPAAVLAGVPSGQVVAMVVANAVIRKVKNPDGYVSEAIDDHNYRLNENARKGEVFITDEEWALLTPTSSGGAFSVRPFGLPDRALWDEWVRLP